MKYLTFKQKLIENDIFLFDSEYRRCYTNMKVLEIMLNNKTNNELSGGGNQKIIISNIIDNINNGNNKYIINKIIDSLKKDNFKSANYAINKYFT